MIVRTRVVVLFRLIMLCVVTASVFILILTLVGVAVYGW